MLIVLGFLLGWQKVNPKATGPAPEVLAIVLTLFATTQADRIERPNRSTLRGRLYTIGNWLIAASVLPTLTLAIALGFEARGATADYWTVGCVVAQCTCLLVPCRSGGCCRPRGAGSATVASCRPTLRTTGTSRRCAATTGGTPPPRR